LRPSSTRLLFFLLVGLPALALASCDGDFDDLPALRTVRLSDGPTELVGRDLSACSHQPSTPGDVAERWCAFVRRAPLGAAELWVVNLRRALLDGARCDGSSPHCLRLTDQLWTGQQPLADGYPTINAFHGDTLIFYPRPASGNRTNEAYRGPIQGWRPGAASPQTLTSDGGRSCLGHQRSPGLVCMDNERRMDRQGVFDLLAGSFGARSDRPLHAIDTIWPEAADGDRLWQVGFSPDGSYLAFSDPVPEGPGTTTKMERLRIVATQQVGLVAPRELLRDVTAWRFSADGKRLYFLRGFNYGRGDSPRGTLAVANFPSGTGARELLPMVSRFDLLGPVPGHGQALAFYQEVPAALDRFGILSDPTRPASLTVLGDSVDDAVVSPDLRYTLLFGLGEGGEAATFVARNDGSGRCRVAAHPGPGIYAPTFVPSPAVLLWGEDAPANNLLTEGWLGDPATCQPRQRFSERLAYYRNTRRGVVWADLEEGARSLRLHHAPFVQGSLDLDHTEEVRRTVDNRVTLIDGRYLLYTVSRGEPDQMGLFLHGPF
jgi:hypothetical protein